MLAICESFTMDICIPYDNIEFGTQGWPRVNIKVNGVVFMALCKNLTYVTPKKFSRYIETQEIQSENEFEIKLVDRRVEISSPLTRLFWLDDGSTFLVLRETFSSDGYCFECMGSVHIKISMNEEEARNVCETMDKMVDIMRQKFNNGPDGIFHLGTSGIRFQGHTLVYKSEQ